MGVGASWQSVIDSLSAGYRFLGRRVELIAIPVLLDLWLWLGPQLSVAPLMEDFVRYYERTVGMEGMPSIAPAASPEILLEASKHSNLMDALVSGSLLHVPSLLATIGQTGRGALYEIGSAAAALGLFTGLSVLGLLIGVFYMNLLARALPLGGAAKPASAGEFVRLVLRQWLRVMIFLVVLFVLLVAGALPVMIGSALLAFLSPALTSLFLFVFLGAVLVLMFYLYFVTAAIVLDDLPVHRAVFQSFAVVRGNFTATLLLIVLTSLISVGITLIMSRLTQFSPVGVAAAILVNAYIGSGLALALLVFYRTRVLRAAAVEVGGSGGGMDGLT